ncbi:aminotransferase class I/II-fold pyridoxal phosphate-dependent enzyme [Streptococcus hyovaginalis]|uniref:aminotransferase class I/II-fold pyridoxal phosphate-dependent enzyme n=1 Tax=Streptococcus hyovaginalis TaxID=149015 RepID=UPI002A83624D|nr:aminotransferase class I/II-fold pyridoxal phosphate-dependent enzyme [Streptococcus hyovaginalis]MDY4510153.1 aminotransferase class I/II-fold pyridoxal phosphate-dependent enzyme [Streptococcus hyovaginalis]
MDIKTAQRFEKLSEHQISRQQELIRSLEAKEMSVINLGRGNPDQATFSSIVTAFEKAILQKSNHSYPPYGGKESLKNQIIAFYDREYQITLSRDEVTTFSGSLAAISALPMLLADPHSYFLLPDLGYFAYQKAIHQAEAIPYYMPLDETNNYFPDYDEITDNVIAKTSGLFLNYPHNPTGLDTEKSRALMDLYETSDTVDTAFSDPNQAIINALINGFSAHAEDIDDTHANLRGHPSAVIFSALLAVSDVDDRMIDVLKAYVIGFEFAGRLGFQAQPQHASKGYHSSGTLGSLGAAVAIGIFK